MAEVLKQVEEVTPEVVHNISAVVSNEEPTLGMNWIYAINSVVPL